MPQEFIRKVTRGHEVVEVDGFIFKRRRHQPEEPAPTAAGSPVNAEGAVGRSAGVSQLSFDEEPVLAAPSQQPPTRDTAAALLQQKERPEQMQELLSQVPGELPEPERFSLLLQVACNSAAQCAEQQLAGSKHGQELSEDVRAVLSDFQDSVSRIVSEGRIQFSGNGCSALSDAANSVQPQVITLQLDQRKSAARALRDALQQEAMQWEQLLQHKDRMSSQAGPTMPDAAAGEADTAKENFDANLPQTACGQGAPVTAAAAPVRGVLRAAEEAAHKRVAMQVEGLCAMVGGVEELVAKAEQQSGAMQAQYHRSKFRTFPHVDSPARLIREIVRPPVRVGSSLHA